MTHGRLMVAHREGFQKSYDLTERVLPSGVDTAPMSEDEVPRYVIDTTFRSLGIADYRDVKFYTGAMATRKIWNSQRKAIEDYMNSLVGDILEEIDFGQKTRYFIYRKYAKKLDKLDQIQDDVPVKILTPFDNITRERHYPSSIWGFDYKIECYVPAPKRVFGYFALPILDQFELRGRVDAKVHRKTGILELKSLLLESDELYSSDGLERLVAGVNEFANFHGCEQVELGKVSPSSVKSKLTEAFKR
jgi:uncharacterized protein YcaQ